MAEGEADDWVHPAVEIRASPIAGRGLFTKRPLPFGTTVLRLAAAGGEGHEVVGSSVAELGTGFPNHSCEPSVGWAGELRLVTMVDLEAGAELVTDYAMAISDPGWLLRCHCPSYRCRQMVEGSDWRIQQLQARYAGWWRPSVQRLIDQSGAR